MGSRIKENPEKIFECFFEVAAPEDNKSDPIIVKRFPLDFKDEGIDKELPRFCFPCDLSTYNPAGQLFTFVLTNIDNIQRFGFCRHPPGARTCLCFLSYLPWFEIFYKVLNTLAELKHSDQDDTVYKIIKQMYNAAIPEPKKLLTISVADNGKSTEMHFSTPDPKSLPRIPESRNFMEFFSAVNPNNMMILFVSLLYERRVLITSEKLSRLTACIHGAASLLYPLYWQHIYTPVLPAHLIDYCCAPMPFLVGVHSSFMKKVRAMPLDEVVILNVDTNIIEAPFDDIEELPTEAMRDLKKNLKNSSACVGDGVARAFLKTLVYLLGSYKDGLTVSKMKEGENKIVFDGEKFVQSRSPHLQPFLERALTLQHFERFRETRIERLSSGQGYPKDVFEIQLDIEKQDGGCLSSKNKLQRQIAGQLLDSKDKVVKARKMVTAKARQGQYSVRRSVYKVQKDGDNLEIGMFDTACTGLSCVSVQCSKFSAERSIQIETKMIQAQGSMRANPDAIRARLRDVGEHVTSFSHQVSQQVKTDEMKATLQKGISKTKDIGKVGIAGVRTATKNVKSRVRGSKDAEDIDTRSRVTMYGTHGITNPYTDPITLRSGSVPSSPAESPVAIRHQVGNNKGLPPGDSMRPMTELFLSSPEVRHYKTIDLNSPVDEFVEEESTTGMDLMNDPDLREVIQKLSPDKPMPQVNQDNDDPPPPIPPRRRNRAKKTSSSPTHSSSSSTPLLPPPAPSTRSGRRSQEGQLINIDDSPQAAQQPKKPTRTFPSPLSANVNNPDAPLIKVSESQESLPKSPSASNLFQFGDSDSSDSTEHLDAGKSLKGSNSSPNLVTYGEQFATQQKTAVTSQAETLVDPFTSTDVVSSNQSSPQSTRHSQESMLSDPFAPVLSKTSQFQTSQAPNLPLKMSSAAAPTNPFADSFVPPTNVPRATNVPTATNVPMATNVPTATSSYNASQRTSLPGAFNISTTASASSTTQPLHPFFVSQIPLQPTSVSTKRSQSVPEQSKDPFADLVSLQLKATSPTWKK